MGSKTVSSFPLQNIRFKGVKPPINQILALSAPLMNYIIKEASSLKALKLYMSCKYFFYKVRTPICHSLYLGNRVESKCMGQFTSVNDSASKRLNHLWLSNLIFVDSEDSSFLSKVIPKFGRISARYLNLRNQDISVKEFLLLTKKRISSIRLNNVSIKDGEGNAIAFEVFFSTLSNAFIIQ